MEFFDIYNPDGTPTGEKVERSIAHEKGILHAAVHIYIYRIQSGKTEILLQKRSDTKDSFPSCWDTSCAGHVSSGENFTEAALKELNEELGLSVSSDSLIHLFDQLVEKVNVFHSKTFRDCEFNKVYKLYLDCPETSLTFQKSEISALKWMDAEHLLSELENKSPDYCIMIDTYKKALEKIKG